MMDAHDPLPANAISLVDAFSEVYFAKCAEAESLITAIDTAISDKERGLAFEEYDESQADVNLYFRGVLQSGVIHTYVRDLDHPDNPSKLDRHGWAAPPLWRPGGGIFSNHVASGMDPGPEGTFFKGAYHPVYLIESEFYNWLYAAFPHRRPHEDQESSDPEITAPSKGVRRGRPSGSGSYEQLDAPLVEKMKQLRESGAVNSIQKAAEAVADEAVGQSKEAKVRRLMARYAQSRREP